MPTHKCPVPDCTAQVPKTQWMCRLHWSHVPRTLQNRLYSAYRDTLNYEGKDAEHRAAMDACLESVKEQAVAK